MQRRLYSAVVDPVGTFPAEAARLVWSLTECAGVSRDSVVLHVVGDPDAQVRTNLEGLGVELVRVEPFPGHAYCNKVQQLASLSLRDFDDVVLLDCDVLVLEEPPRAYGRALGKPVDFSNPPIGLLRTIFAEAGVPLELSKGDIDGAVTARANVNGGVYVIDRAVFSALADAWRRWATWCVDRIDLLPGMGQHADQVSFALAIAAQRIPFAELPRRFNVPTHVPQSEGLDCDPAILHYHRALNDQQLLHPVQGLPRVNRVISELNARLAR
jgi:hypothetical protein